MSEQVELSILDTFKTRKSVRNYDSQWPAEKQAVVEAVVREANEIPTPFGTTGNLGIHGKGLGTMGFVSGEAGWILLQVPKEKETAPDYANYLMDAAFRAQIAVLKLTQKGISTVWIGGTFNESKAEQDTPGFKIPCVVAFGINAQSKRFFDKAMGWMGVGQNRKDFSELFFNDEKKEPFTQETLGKYGNILSSLRLNPSAVNAQPARLLVNGNTFTVFDSKPSSYTPFDMGIMLGSAYFYSEGKITYNTTETDKVFPKGGKYIASFTVEPSVLEWINKRKKNSKFLEIFLERF